MRGPESLLGEENSMDLILIATGIDETEDVLGLDVTLAFSRLGLHRGREIEFHEVKDNQGMDSGIVIRGEVHRGYLELDGVVAARSPRILIILHHALIEWQCYEIQLFSEVCAASPDFQSWAGGVSDAYVSLGGWEGGEELHRKQFPSAGELLWNEIDPVYIEVVPSLAPMTERLKIEHAPLETFDFPGGDTYEQELEILARTLAGIYDHHPWLEAGVAVDSTP